MATSTRWVGTNFDKKATPQSSEEMYTKKPAEDKGGAIQVFTKTCVTLPVEEIRLGPW